MTGFGRARVRAPGAEFEVEIRSVNHRYLQVRQRLPEDFSNYEPEIEELVRKRLHRGSVTISASLVRNQSNRSIKLRLDLAKGYLDQLRQLKKSLKLSGEPTLDRLASFPGVFEFVEAESNRTEKEFTFLRKAVEQALNQLDAAREREGKALEKDLLKRRDHLSKLCSEIHGRAPSLLAEYRDRLKKRTDELLAGSTTKLREEDLAREIAIFATRSDITEEITRLKTHLSEFARLLKQDKEVGRQMDFLLQEMNRESNTIGSKSSDAKLAHLVVEMKGEIDKIREQIQNLE